MRRPAPDATTATGSHCANCGTPADEEYCAHCGQATRTFDVPVGALAREIASETLSLDSRITRTLKPLLLQPGWVAREYVAGRRASFVPPIRLYLFASFAMFLAMTLGPGIDVQNVTFTWDAGDGAVAPAGVTPTVSGEAVPIPAGGADPAGEAGAGSAQPAVQGEIADPDAELGQRVSRALQIVAADNRAFTRDLYNRLAQAMFFLVPAFAILLKLAYPRRLYVQHAVFAIYLHSLAFLIVAVVSLPDALRLPVVGEWLDVALLAVPVHLLIGMRRFYGESWPRTVAKFGFVSVGYLFMGTVTALAVLVRSLLAV